MIREYINILDIDECNQLIEIGKPFMLDATTLGENIKNYRTAQNTWVNDESELTSKIKKIIFEKTGLPIENQEKIHLVKYDVGGEYKEHQDFFHPNTSYYETQMTRGGQRMYSCLFYLNDEFKGGETHFPKVPYTVKPKVGKLVVWDNLNPDGSPNFDSLHAGLPVIFGEKWICIVWVREQKFI